jgi:hypothetical protein
VTCRACGSPSEVLVCPACLLEARATRLLAERALEARAIGVVDWEFIDGNPGRAGEVAEFSAWLAR